MDVTLLYFADCPNWAGAEKRLGVLVDEIGDITVTRHLVETPEESERTGFRGSPSILVDGVDLFAEPGSAVGLSCRRCRTPEGYGSAPMTEHGAALAASS